MFKRTKELESQIDQFCDKVDEGAMSFKISIVAYLDGNFPAFEDKLKQVNELESQADTLRRDVERRLYEQTLIPESRGDVLGLLRDMSEAEAFFAEGGTILRLWEGPALADPRSLAAHVAAHRPVWITTGGCDGRRAGDHADASLRQLRDLGATGFLVNDPAACRAVLTRYAEPQA